MFLSDRPVPDIKTAKRSGRETADTFELLQSLMLEIPLPRIAAASRIVGNLIAVVKPHEKPGAGTGLWQRRTLCHSLTDRLQ